MNASKIEVVEEDEDRFLVRLEFIAVVGEQAVNGLHLVWALDLVDACAQFVEMFGCEHAFLTAVKIADDQKETLS